MSEKKENVGGIWKKTINTKNGPTEILSISIGDKRYTAWPNTYKQEGDRSPDFKINIDTFVPKQQKSQDADLPF